MAGCGSGSAVVAGCFWPELGSAGREEHVGCGCVRSGGDAGCHHSSSGSTRKRTKPTACT